VGIRGLGAILILLLVPACGKTRRPAELDVPSNGDAAAAGVSWTGDVWPILLLRCHVCHTSGSGAQQVPDMLMTDAGTTYTAWVRVFAKCNPNLFRVLPGESALSFVFDKIAQEAPLCGQRMPLQGPQLDDLEQATIRDWIDQGALRN
jgi:hypothetical protein